MAPKKDARLKTLQELATYVPCSHYGLGMYRFVMTSFCNRDPSLRLSKCFFWLFRGSSSRVMSRCDGRRES